MKKVPFSPTRFLARKTWGFLLWILRRRWIKRVRRAMIERQKRIGTPQWLRIDVHDRWAFRYGQAVIAFCFNLLFGSVMVSASLIAALRLYDSGVLAPPDEVIRQLHPQTLEKASEAPRL